MLKILKEHQNKNSLHHAYLIEGEKEIVRNKICEFLEVNLGFSIKGNPDFWNEDYETFGIDDARKIKENQTKKPFGNKKIFVLSCNSMTTEAQNSLLKLFEEPSKETHFFIISDLSEIFLPTLKSRMVIIKDVNLRGQSTEKYKNKSNDFEFAKKFLKINKSERLKLLKNIIDEKDKEKTISFVNSLEILLRKGENDIFKNKNAIFALREIVKCRNYLNDRAPSVKLILEHLALIIP